MALSYVTYTGDGSNKNFSVSFPYISQADVTVLVNRVSVSFTWLNAGMVQTTVAPASGSVVRVQRTTPKAQPLVDFGDGSTLSESDLDTFSQQMLYIAQEASDSLTNVVGSDATTDQMNAHNLRIINVADPVNVQDAVTKGWAETSMTSTLALAIGANSSAQSAAASAAALVAEANAAVAAAEALIASGGSGGNSVLPSKVEAQAMTTTPDALFLAGLNAAGDGGGGLFVKVASQPTHTAKFQMTSSGQWYEYAEDVLNVKAFGAKGDLNTSTGIGTNDTAAVNACFEWARVTGKVVYFPRGKYLVNRAIYKETTTSYTAGPLPPGLRCFGDGIGHTFLVSNDGTSPVLHIEGDTSRYLMGGWLKGMTISSMGGAGTIGLYLHRLFNFTFSDLYFVGFAQDGIQMPTVFGDADPANDGANHNVFDQVRMYGCGRWGMNFVSAANVNESSYTFLRNVTLEECGTTAGAVGGGMYWRGQNLNMDHVAFVTCKNRGLYIDGNPNQGCSVLGRNITCENTVGKGIECTGVQGLAIDQFQVYSNQTFQTTHGIHLTGTNENIHIDGGKIRITHDQPITLFADLNNATNAVAENMTWAAFSGTGKVKASGLWKIKTSSGGADVSARLSVSQDCGTAATALLFNSVDADPQACYSTSAGTFKAPSAGLYHFTASVAITAPAAGETATLNIYRLDFDQVVATKKYKWAGGSDVSMEISRLVPLVANERVQITATNSVGRAFAIGGGFQNFLSVLQR
jgi:hypothetical protein